MSVYRLVLEVPELPALNTSRNVHWRVKVRERAKWAILLRKAKGRRRGPKQPLEQTRVTYTRYSSREPDYTNLVQSFKLIEDLLQPQGEPYRTKAGKLVVRNPGGLGIIRGDDPASVTSTYEWRKVKRGDQRVRIEIASTEKTSPQL